MMLNRFSAKLLLAALGVALVAGGPAFAASAKKPTTHTSTKAAQPAEATTDSLNAQSLAAAQAGKDFSPAK